MYCAVDDLITAIGEQTVVELSNDNEEATEIDDEVAGGHILKADNLIDGYLREKYALPLTTVSNIIKDISIDLAVYFLYTRRSDHGVPEEVKDKYKDRIALLKDIQKSNFILDIPLLGSGSTEDSIYGSGEYRVNKTKSDRIFNKELLDSF